MSEAAYEAGRKLKAWHDFRAGRITRDVMRYYGESIRLVDQMLRKMPLEQRAGLGNTVHAQRAALLRQCVIDARSRQSRGEWSAPVAMFAPPPPIDALTAMSGSALSDDERRTAGQWIIGIAAMVGVAIFAMATADD